MTTLVVPALEDEPWPTLGPGVVAAIEGALSFGPGDLRGEPAKVDDEKRALIYRAFEVYPKDHALAGRRRFKRVAWSIRKGLAKTEVAAWIAAIELHPEGPVRCDGWVRQGRLWRPVGAPVRDPYIPMIAYTEEQTEDLAYAALMVVISEGRDVDLFDVGLERVARRNGDGKAVALSGSPNARDGARTTFQHFDETHRFTSERLRRAHRTMMANIPKRKLADAWSLETTTAFTPGEGSIAEEAMDEARRVARTKDPGSRLFFFHRQADEREPEKGGYDLSKTDELRAAVVEASGPVGAKWSDIDGIVDLFTGATPADRVYYERVYLNRLVQGASKAFDAERWKELAYKRPHVVPRGALITWGFDGSKTEDSTALVATEVASGYQWIAGLWERPDPAPPGWEVPKDEVDRAVIGLHERFTVARGYGDPATGWDTALARWAGLYGKEVVGEWWTNRPRPMSYALRAYAEAMRSGEVGHCAVADRTCGSFSAHIGNAVAAPTGFEDDGGPLWIIYKERPGSPNKIDAAMAGCLSWEARSDAITAGVLNVEEFESAYARKRSMIL